SGAFGTLGSGTFSLSGGGFAYDGSTANSAKPVLLNGGGVISVGTPGSNLTMTGAFSESSPGSFLVLYGSGIGASPGTLSLTATNSYTGSTNVSYQGILAVPTIANGGINSPIGASSNSPSNLSLGSAGLGRGDLLL